MKQLTIDIFNNMVANEKRRIRRTLRQDPQAKVSLREMLNLQEKLEEYVRSDDPRMSGAVSINHLDGSHLYFNNAWYEIFPAGMGYDGPVDWILIFTEHHGSHLYHSEDLTYWEHYCKKK